MADLLETCLEKPKILWWRTMFSKTDPGRMRLLCACLCVCLGRGGGVKHICIYAFLSLFDIHLLSQKIFPEEALLCMSGKQEHEESTRVWGREHELQKVYVSGCCDILLPNWVVQKTVDSDSGGSTLTPLMLSGGLGTISERV